MPDKCFVPGCNSGYKSCSVKKAMFKPPSQPELLEKWRAAIPRADRVLGDHDRVCELHFAPHLIERTFHCQVGNEQWELQRARPKLTEDAVPHLFPNCPKYLSKKAAIKRTIPSRCSEQPRAKKRKFSSDPATDHQMPDTDTAFIDVPLTYEGLSEEAVTLCPTSWTTVCISEDYICFGRIGIQNGQMLVTSSVSISRAMNIQVYYKGVPSGVVKCAQICSRDQLIAVFEQVNKSQECIGNPEQHFSQAVSNSRIGIRESSGVWRHHDCERLTVGSARCGPCKKFRKILQVAVLRKSAVKKLRVRAVQSRVIHRLQKRIFVNLWLLVSNTS